MKQIFQQISKKILNNRAKETIDPKEKASSFIGF
jgi:hypothetical protein